MEKITPIKLHSQKGFTTLMALGMIAILLILVTGLTLSYMREIRLSRAFYDETLSSMSAEGMFEYAMLKIRNHPAGFRDSVTTADIDGKNFTLTTPRALGLTGSYKIESNAISFKKKVATNNHLIIPLFIADEAIISGSSKKPMKNTSVMNTQNLRVSGLSDISWVIIAMSGSESIGLSGSGDIITGKIGIIRMKKSDCYDANASIVACSSSSVLEEVPYLYDEEKTVSDFLSSVTNPYFLMTNTTLSEREVELGSTTPFSLPVLKIEAQAKKNGSIQTFRFEEDTSKYYDALKYGIYNTSP